MKNAYRILTMLVVSLVMLTTINAQSLLKSKYYNKASYSLEANLHRFPAMPSKKFVSRSNSLMGLNAEFSLFHYANLGAGIELSDSVTNYRLQFGAVAPVYYWKWGDASIHFDMVKNFSKIRLRKEQSQEQNQKIRILDLFQ